MTAAPERVGLRPWLLHAAAVVLFMLDRRVKAAALSWPASQGDDPVALALFNNTGIAFSIPVPPGIFWPAAIALFGLLLALYAVSLQQSVLAASAAFFIIAGALSNLIDRAAYGAIIDYVIFFGISAVNLADAMIVGGVLALLALRRRKTRTGTAAKA